MPGSLAGSRIREARRRKGLTQKALAAEVGISTSYLNLIEHNRRRIGGKTLNSISLALDTPATELAEGGNPMAIADLHAMAADDAEAAVDPSTAETFAGRFPEWAQLLLSARRRMQDQQAVISALSDRLTHDPFLSENVHAMLSHITAIRSTAGILSHHEDVDADQRNRFSRSIHTESVRLSETASRLADYLGRAASQPDAAVTAEEALDQFLQRNRFHFDTIDREAEATADLPEEAALHRLDGVCADILDASPPVAKGPARSLALNYLARYARDAFAMPFRRFAETARTLSYNPSTLATEFRQDIPAVFRRLAVLKRPDVDAPRFGLIVVTASGYPLMRQPLPDFALPRHGNACALWPLFLGFGQPGQPMLSRIEHDNRAAFTTLTIAAPRQLPEFGQPADLISSMLIVSERESPFETPNQAPRPVGTSCRICTRAGCAARAEPQLFES